MRQESSKENMREKKGLLLYEALVLVDVLNQSLRLAQAIAATKLISHHRQKGMKRARKRKRSAVPHWVIPNEESSPWPGVNSGVKSDDWFYAPETDEAGRQQRREHSSGPYSLSSWWGWGPKMGLADAASD
ncbi:hypothetical protein FOZ60_013228 [Perkinsus olseni]|uniref:Uncharacterized protein n=1 Tax=Perkinsus olseni TaxID=32597 RepID=A0A7J6N9N4_PEROL|nr:hypothetical protein FOZ60_013228 [Perkinsus olseni]